MTARDASHFVVERKFAWAVIASVVGWVVTGVWWASDLSARVRTVESEQVQQRAVIERIARIETDVVWLRRAVEQLVSRGAAPNGNF